MVVNRMRVSLPILDSLVDLPLENCRASVVKLNVFRSRRYDSANNALQSRAIRSMLEDELSRKNIPERILQANKCNPTVDAPRATESRNEI